MASSPYELDRENGQQIYRLHGQPAAGFARLRSDAHADADGSVLAALTDVAAIAAAGEPLFEDESFATQNPLRDATRAFFVDLTGLSAQNAAKNPEHGPRSLRPEQAKMYSF
ncbi:hypothetical protein WMF38_07495 [Sorangium sp. So ce118]